MWVPIIDRHKCGRGVRWFEGMSVKVFVSPLLEDLGVECLDVPWFGCLSD